MGCKSSKFNEPPHGIRVVQSAGQTRNRTSITPGEDSIDGGLKRSSISNMDIFNVIGRKSSKGIGDNLDDNDSLFGSNSESRQTSAGSKFSKQSDDSGFDVNDNGNSNDKDGWGGIITEESNTVLVERIEKEFSERQLDLLVSGTSVRQIKQDREQERKEESEILAALHQEGLILRPESRVGGCVSFEITEDPALRTPLLRRLPARLEKLESQTKKKELTTKEIEAKLQRAEERRKRKEQERIERINATHRKEQDDVLCALEAFQDHQKRTEKVVLQRLGSARENREQKLLEMRDKLKAKREHEDKVRERKQFARELGIFNQEEEKGDDEV